MRLTATAFAAAALLAACGNQPSSSAASSAPTEAYPGPWRTDGPALDQIAVALGRNSVSGCGEFHYRFSQGNPDSGEALVYCTRDGREWAYYLVFYNINEVMRIKAEPGVPNPEPILSPDS